MHSIKRNPIVSVQNLYKVYGEKQVLQDINFEVYPGETLAIIGPSGSGKSTILKILSGLEDLTKGKISLADHKIGMAFQYSALLNSYTVEENVAFALHESLLSPDEKKKIVREKLHMLGLESYMESMPDSLSGGQQKRVSFARAIANQPRIIFYDEPTAGLDPINSTVVEDYINLLAHTQNSANIVVTHQHSTIRRTADKIICLCAGKIVWTGKVDELDTSENPYIRQFIDGKKEGPFSECENAC